MKRRRKDFGSFTYISKYFVAAAVVVVTVVIAERERKKERERERAEVHTTL